MESQPDYETIINHIRMKSQAKDSYISMVNYLLRKDVPEAEAKEIIRTVVAEEKAAREAEAPERRKKMRRNALLFGGGQFALGLVVFLGCFFYNAATQDAGGGVFIRVLILQWVAVLFMVVAFIRTLYMAIRKAEDFDHLDFS